MSVTFNTNKGDLKFELYIAEARQTCERFLMHCATGHYTGSKFHRLIRGSLLQGGIIENDDQGDDDRSMQKVKKEIVEGLSFNDRGVLGMVSADGDEDGKSDCNHESQFFVTLGPANHLDGSHTVFGRVIYGFDTLDAIQATPLDGESPKRDIIIESVVIHANPLADAV